MDVIHVPDKIALVTNRVFPVASLPKRELAIRVPPDSDPRSKQAGAEVSFDPPPAPSEIRISLRQGQDCMKMIREDDDRIDRKGPLLAGHAKRRAKRADMIDQSG